MLAPNYVCANYVSVTKWCITIKYNPQRRVTVSLKTALNTLKSLEKEGLQIFLINYVWARSLSKIGRNVKHVEELWVQNTSHVSIILASL